MGDTLRELGKELRRNWKIVGALLAALIVVVAFSVLSQSGGSSTKLQEQTSKPTGKETTVAPEPLPSIQILPGEVIAKEGKNSFSFHFPTTWSGTLQQNTQQHVTIILTPPAINGVPPTPEDSITFEREQQNFLDLEGIKNGYSGGIGTTKEYYSKFTASKVSLGGKPGYHISSTSSGSPLTRMAYFTLSNYKSYTFSAQGSTPSTIDALAPTLQQIAESLSFNS